MATETEFIDWIRENKGVEIDRTMQFSTYGSLGKEYKTSDGYYFFYGLSVKGYPPHLDLSFCPTLKIDNGKTTFNCFVDYSELQRIFYSDNISHSDRYEILTKRKYLIIN